VAQFSRPPTTTEYVCEAQLVLPFPIKEQLPLARFEHPQATTEPPPEARLPRPATTPA
jgi:hypothetical protein